jgi:hypothetical protein
MTFDYATAIDGFEQAYGGIDRLVAALSRADLLAPTRCRGWLVADVLFHELTDAQRALIALATPVAGPPDVDYATYWRAFAADQDDPFPGIWSIRRAAAAYRDGAGAMVIWSETSPAAVRAAAAADPDGHVATQGHVIAVPDFLVTLATEAVIHHLDMTLDLADAPGPHAGALALAATTLDALGGPDARRSPEWTVEEYVLAATGRRPVDGGTPHSYPLLA